MPTEGSISSYAEAIAYLKTLKARGVQLGLARMQAFMSVLGHPQSSVPCIHIAGTNGKGSVAAMIESILRSAGWRTGLYTSPHLVRLGERIQIDRQPLSEREIAEYVMELKPVVARFAADGGGAESPSYFEFMTAMAFLHFARQRCDIAVIEVGLGGRLDATNVVIPEVSVITSIGLDHCELLGGTFAAIASEKAGIVKPNRPVVIGRLPAEAERVVRDIAAKVGSKVISAEEAYGNEIGRYPKTNLKGDYQRLNAGVASLAVRALPPRWRISDEAIERGLGSVRWFGRWQTFSVSSRVVVVDSSHNAEGAAVLDKNLRRLAQDRSSAMSTGWRTDDTAVVPPLENSGTAPIVVIGVLGEARARPLIEVVCRHARQLHFVVPQQARACSFEQLRALVPKSFTGGIVNSTVASLFPSSQQCVVGSPGDTVVVTGSIYLAGEVLGRLDPTLGPVESDLQDF